MLIAFNKPYGVLSQFTAQKGGQRTLQEFNFPRRVYPLGRLDADSEGLLLLSDEPGLNQQLLHPSQGHWRRYWAQVERVPTAADLTRLAQGVSIGGHQSLPCRAWIITPEPRVPPREPPIRFRKTVPTCWVGLEMIEGKNRQVRKMTAAVGYPTLRLIRVQIGRFELGSLTVGTWRLLEPEGRQQVLSDAH